MVANDMQLLGYKTKTTYDDLKIMWLLVRGPGLSYFITTNQNQKFAMNKVKMYCAHDFVLSVSERATTLS